MRQWILRIIVDPDATKQPFRWWESCSFAVIVAPCGYEDLRLYAQIIIVRRNKAIPLPSCGGGEFSFRIHLIASIIL